MHAPILSDDLEFQGEFFLAFTPETPTLLITRNRSTGIINVQSWSDRYCNAWYRGSHATHELLADVDILRAGDDGTWLARSDAINALIRDASDSYELTTALELDDIIDVEASVDFNLIEAELEEVDA